MDFDELERLIDLFNTESIFRMEMSPKKPKQKDSCKDKEASKSKAIVAGVKRIIFNNPYTIVFWEDGTKTKVKCADDVPFDEMTGFVWAYCKKVFGDGYQNRIRNTIKEFKVEGRK